MVDGWFRTGDLGTKDAEGFITIVDRKKDLIIRGGFNVYPREVEEVFARHPAIGQVAVIGLPDDRARRGDLRGRRADPGADAQPDRRGAARLGQGAVGRHKYPRQVRFVDELPLGPEPQGAQARAAPGPGMIDDLATILM